MIPMVKRQVKKNAVHIIVPFVLILLSKFNEKYYLQTDHGSLVALYFIRILLFAFGIYLSRVIGNRFSEYKRHKRLILNEKQKAFMAVFTWFLLWYGFWLVAYYPGSYTSDTLNAIRQLSYMDFHDWFSYFHPLTYLFLYQFFPHLIVIGIAQVLLASFVFSDIISYLYSKFNFYRKWKILFLVIFVIFLSSISSITYFTFYYMRDIPYSFLHLYFAFYLFKICIERGKDKISNNETLTIVSLGLILSIYRGEGWIILFSSLIVLFLYGKFYFKTFVKIFASSLVLFFTLDVLLPKFLGVVLISKNHYRLTLVAYPLGFILREGKNYISLDYEEDKVILSKLVDIKALQENTNSYDIQVFQQIGQSWNKTATDEEWTLFYNRVYKIFLDNPHLFLAARTANFVSQLFAFENRAERMFDFGRAELTYSECMKNKDNNLWCRLYFEEKVSRMLLNMIPNCSKNSGVCGNFNLMKLEKIDFNWHWNSVFAFFLSITVLLLYKYLPVSAMASSVILSRILLVFLTAPCAFFRYVFSLYLFGIFILVFIVLEITLSKKYFNKNN